MNINNKIEEIIDALKNSDDFSDAYVIRAHPSCFKPTRQEGKMIIAVSEGASRYELKEIGGDTYVGEYQVIIKIYRGYGNETVAFYDIIKKIVDLLDDNFAKEMSINEAKDDNIVGAITTKFVLTFYDWR